MATGRNKKSGLALADIRRIALSFPGVEEGTSYGTLAFRVSRKFITRLHDEGEAMVMRVPFEEREMLMERDKLNHDIQAILDTQTDAWGIKVANVEIKHVDLDTSMIRAIAKQAEAERERRAKIISAEGEEQAAAKLVEAARKLASEPSAMQLRYLGALQEIAGQGTNTIVFPFSPKDITDLVKGKNQTL